MAIKRMWRARQIIGGWPRCQHLPACENLQGIGIDDDPALLRGNLQRQG